MDDKREYEYLLGSTGYNDFEILSRCLNPAPREIAVGCLFYVNEYSMGDGDGMPSTYFPNAYKTVPRSVFENALKMMHDTGDKMDDLVKDDNPLDREIKEGDYLYYKGSFYFIEGLSSITGKCRMQEFYSDHYNVSIDTESETFYSIEKWIEENDIEDLSEFQVITKAIFEKALNIAKSGILEVQDFLRNILTS